MAKRSMSYDFIKWFLVENHFSNPENEMMTPHKESKWANNTTGNGLSESHRDPIIWKLVGRQLYKDFRLVGASLWKKLWIEGKGWWISASLGGFRIQIDIFHKSYLGHYTRLQLNEISNKVNTEVLQTITNFTRTWGHFWKF